MLTKRGMGSSHWGLYDLVPPLIAKKESESHSVVSNSFWPYGPLQARLLCPWNSPGKINGVGCHSLLQGIFPTQESNPGLLPCRQILYHLSHQEALRVPGGKWTLMMLSSHARHVARVYYLIKSPQLLRKGCNGLAKKFVPYHFTEKKPNILANWTLLFSPLINGKQAWREDMTCSRSTQ